MARNETLTEAQRIAMYSINEGVGVVEVTRELNDAFDEVFYAIGNTIFMKREPDYLPPFIVVSC